MLENQSLRGQYGVGMHPVVTVPEFPPISGNLDDTPESLPVGGMPAAEQGVDSQSLVPYGYWRVPGERPALYEHLGVRWFKKWVPTTGDYVRRRFGMEAGGLVGDNREEQLTDVIRVTKEVEAVHLATAGIVGALAVAAEATDYAGTASRVALGAFQVAVNVYPIMVQRYNRLRALRVLDRIDKQRS